MELQRQTLRLAEARFKAGTTGELDVVQARSTLEQTEAQIPELEINLRQVNNQLCILLGIPPEELRARVGAGHIPIAPPEVAAGIPAELLRRRPDVRRAERLAGAQERAKLQAASVEDAERAIRLVVAQYREGTIDFTRVTQIQLNLVPLLDTLAQARGEISLGLIQVYRALGGGWQIRLNGGEPPSPPPPGISPRANGISPFADLKPAELPPALPDVPHGTRP